MKNRTSNAMRCVSLSTILLAGAAVHAFPGNEYACQMETVGAGHGLVMVQTTTREKAAEIALEQPARTATGQSFKSSAVVECIELRKERFQDDAFHAYLRSLQM